MGKTSLKGVAGGEGGGDALGFDGSDVDTFELDTHSFIVKVWLEDGSENGDGPKWRGHVTHVPSKRRRYVEDLGSLAEFVGEYLSAMGVEDPKASQDLKRRLGKRATQERQ